MNAICRIASCALLLPLGCDGGAPAFEDARASRDGGAAIECDVPGAVEEVACGRCGTVTRFCNAEHEWGYGPCELEAGLCTPGETRDAACGLCGTTTELCGETCAWTAIGACTEGSCGPEACESAGTTENVSCGRCGTRQRFCTAEMTWAYGPCEGEHGCEPGTSTVESCGLCGEQEMRCDASCEWTALGECAGDGACGSGDQLGEACTEGSCGEGLRCDVSDGLATVCRATCTTDADCPETTFCGSRGACSDRCDFFGGSTGCPSGTQCVATDLEEGHAISWCITTATALLGDVCEGPFPYCGSGLLCVNDGGFIGPNCRRLCDAAHPCTTGSCSYWTDSALGMCP